MKFKRESIISTFGLLSSPAFGRFAQPSYSGSEEADDFMKSTNDQPRLPGTVHRAQPQAHFIGDLGPRPALRPQLGHSGGIHGHARAPDALALSASHG
jgi:hypothetical protein